MATVGSVARKSERDGARPGCVAVADHHIRKWRAFRSRVEPTTGGRPRRWIHRLAGWHVWVGRCMVFGEWTTVDQQVTWP